MEEKEIKKKARKRAQEKVEFFQHFFIYLMVNLVVIASNLIFNSEFLYFPFVLFGWGIGIVIHFINVFGFGGMMSNYLENQTQREEERIRRSLEK